MKLGLNCDYCNEVFNSDYRAKNHYKSKHPGRERVIILSGEKILTNKGFGANFDQNPNLDFEYFFGFKGIFLWKWLC